MIENYRVARIGRTRALLAAVAVITVCGAARSSQRFIPIKSQGRSAPKIFGVQIAKVSFDRLLLHWQTDRPATSRVVAYDLATQNEIDGSGDLVLRTDHWVWVSGLKPATEYAFQAMSVSYAYGRAVANPVFEQTMLKP